MHGDKSITLHDFKTGINTVLADGFVAPTHVVNYQDKLLVSDRGTGELLSIDVEGNKNIIVEGLNSPEGIAIKGGSIFVFEGDTGEVKEIKIIPYLLLLESIQGNVLNLNYNLLNGFQRISN